MTGSWLSKFKTRVLSVQDIQDKFLCTYRFMLYVDAVMLLRKSFLHTQITPMVYFCDQF